MNNKMYLTHEDLFQRDPLEFIKEAASTKLPHDSKEWPEAIMDNFHSAHSWCTPTNIKVVMGPQDKEKGTAIGAIVLDKNYLLPFVIKDFKLFPLDLFFGPEGRLKLFSRKTFKEEAEGKTLGQAVPKGTGEANDMSIWGMTRPPHTGRYAFASFVDPDDAETLLKNSITTEQLEFAMTSNPYFKTIVNELLSPSEGKTASYNHKGEWHLSSMSDYTNDVATNLSKVAVMEDMTQSDIPCILGNYVIEPVTKTASSRRFGVELNAKDSSRYFITNNSIGLGLVDIAKDDKTNYTVTKTASVGDAGLQAYLVPYKGSLAMVGPFTVISSTNNLEKIGTAAGVMHLTENEHAEDIYTNEDGLLVMGSDAVRVHLGSDLKPMEQKVASAFDSYDASADEYLTIKTLPDDFYGYKGYVEYINKSASISDPSTFVLREHLKYPSNINVVLEELSKIASLSEEVRNTLNKQLRQGTNVTLVRYNTAKTKIASIQPSISSEQVSNYKEAIKLASLLATPFNYRTLVPGENGELLIKEAKVQDSRVLDTVDTLLSLDFISEENKQKFYDNIDKLADSRDLLAELLLSSRLGLDLDPIPLKLGLRNVDASLRDLTGLRMVEETNI